LKIPDIKKAGGAAQGVVPEFKPQYREQKKKKNYLVDPVIFSLTKSSVVIYNYIFMHTKITLCEDKEDKINNW
jgi:hypothetical protein